MKRLGIAAAIVAGISVMLIIAGLGLCIDAFTDHENSPFTTEYRRTAEASVEGVDTIMLAADAADITFKTAETDTVSAKLHYRNYMPSGRNPVLVCEKDGDVIKISIHYEFVSIINIDIFRLCELEVTVPESYTGTLSCDFNAAKAELTGLSPISSISVEAGASDIKMNEVTGSVHMKIAAGKAEVRYARVDGDAQYYCDAGKLTVYVPENADIECERFEGGASSFQTDFGFGKSGGTIGEGMHLFRFSGNACTVKLKNRN